MVVAGHAKLRGRRNVVPLEDAFPFEDFEVSEGDGGVSRLSEKASFASTRNLGAEVVLEYFVNFS